MRLMHLNVVRSSLIFHAGVTPSSIIIRNWQTSAGSRRALQLQADSVSIGSLANLGNGVSAYQAMQTLRSADQSGALQVGTMPSLSLQTSSFRRPDHPLNTNLSPRYVYTDVLR